MSRVPSLVPGKHSINMSCYLTDLNFSKLRKWIGKQTPSRHIYMSKATRALPTPLSMDPAAFSTDLHSTPTISMFNGVPLWHCPLPPLKFACHGPGPDTSM